MQCVILGCFNIFGGVEFELYIFLNECSRSFILGIFVVLKPSVPELCLYLCSCAISAAGLNGNGGAGRAVNEPSCSLAARGLAQEELIQTRLRMQTNQAQATNSSAQMSS